MALQVLLNNEDGTSNGPIIAQAGAATVQLDAASVLDGARIYIYGGLKNDEATLEPLEMLSAAQIKNGFTTSYQGTNFLQARPANPGENTNLILESVEP